MYLCHYRNKYLYKISTNIQPVLHIYKKNDLTILSNLRYNLKMEKLNYDDNSIVFLTCFKLVKGTLIIALLALKGNLDLWSRLLSKLSTTYHTLTAGNLWL